MPSPLLGLCRPLSSAKFLSLAHYLGNTEISQPNTGPAIPSLAVKVVLDATQRGLHERAATRPGLSCVTGYAAPLEVLPNSLDPYV